MGRLRWPGKVGSVTQSGMHSSLDGNIKSEEQTEDGDVGVRDGREKRGGGWTDKGQRQAQCLLMP